jgi:hypothetical protein
MRAMNVRRLVFPSFALLLTACATTWDARWAEQGPLAQVAPNAEALAEADAAWAQRVEPAKLDEALTKWERLYETAPSAELAVKIARGHHLRGDGIYVLEGHGEARDAEYQQGLDWATKALKRAAPEFAKAMAEGRRHETAIALAPKEAVPAMYWYATNLGKWAASKGFGTRERYRADVKATMERVKALDEGYFFAGPWRYFGTFEAVTAGLAGGSLKRSEQSYEKALELAPNYLGAKVLWADFLCTKARDQATYRRLLEEVIAADPSLEPSIEPENRIEQQKAKKLLSEIDQRF